MSLPTYAVMYNEFGEEIDRQFYNVGWVMNDLVLHEDMDIWFNARPNVAMIKVYDKEFTRESVRVWLEEEQKRRAERAREMMQKRKEFKFEVPTMKIPAGVVSMPALIAEQIAGVQPMSDYNGQMFAMKPLTAPTGEVFKIKMVSVDNQD